MSTRKPFLAFAYFFLIVTAYYLIKPVRSALVLSSLGSQQLPWLYLLTALILGTLVGGYARLVSRLAPRRLMQGLLVGLGAQLLVFRWALQLPYAWISGLFYVWVSMFSVLAVTQFWMVADDLFTQEEAKRWFGFIGSGGILGGMTGGLLASLLVRWLKSEELLVIAAGLVLLCVGLLGPLWSYRRPEAAAGTRTLDGLGRVQPRASVLSTFREFRYLRHLLVLVVAAKAVSTIIDYQFNGLVELTVLDKEARTALFGAFYTALNVASLIVQLALTSRLLNRLGVYKSLAMLPVGLAVGSIGMLLVPGLASAILVALYDRSLNYSLSQTGKEILYIPVPSRLRYQIKPLIDAAAFRFAQGLAATGLLIFQHVGHLPPQSSSLLALPLIGCWLVAIHRLQTGQPAWAWGGSRGIRGRAQPAWR